MAKMVFDSNSPVDTYLLNMRTDESYRTQRSKLRAFVKAAGGENLSEFDWEELNADTIRFVLKKMRSEGKKSSTINATLCGVKGVFLEMFNKKKIDIEEYIRVKGIKSDKASDINVGRSLTKSEIQEMLESPSSRPIDVRNNAIMAVIMGCGLRRKEVPSLEVRHINIDAETPFLRIKGKGNKYRDIFMPDFTLEALERWLAYRTREEGPLFPGITKNDSIGYKAITSQRVYYIVKSRISNASPHDIRRTFITKLLENGADLITAQKLAGHASPETTVRYDKRGEGQRIKAIKTLDSLV